MREGLWGSPSVQRRGDYHSASEEGSALYMKSSSCNVSTIEERRKDVVRAVFHISKELR